MGKQKKAEPQEELTKKQKACFALLCFACFLFFSFIFYYYNIIILSYNLSLINKDIAKQAWEKKKKELGTDARDYKEYMKECLEKRWGIKVTYSCAHCLQEAFEDHGYVTDEDLIAASVGD
jgi:hypothetical protein